MSNGKITAGTTVTINIAVTAEANNTGVIDLQLHSPTVQIGQRGFAKRTFRAGKTVIFTATFPIPADSPIGKYTAKVRIVKPGIGTQH